MSNEATRGFGLLENFLSRRRAALADKLIFKELRQGNLLDIGCGSQPLFLLQINFKEKYGLDPNVISSSSDNLKIIKAEFNGQALPFTDNFFQTITILAVVEHLLPEQVDNFFKEIWRILAVGGCLILTTPAPHSQKILEFMACLRLVSREEVAEHKKYYNLKELAAFCRRAGFEPEKITEGYFELGFNQWLLAVKQTT
jgi:SAM-dependent methyltransferase